MKKNRPRRRHVSANANGKPRIKRWRIFCTDVSLIYGVIGYSCMTKILIILWWSSLHLNVSHIHILYTWKVWCLPAAALKYHPVFSRTHWCFGCPEYTGRDIWPIRHTDWNGENRHKLLSMTLIRETLHLFWIIIEEIYLLSVDTFTPLAIRKLSATVITSPLW